MARLKDVYKKEIVPELMKLHGYKNVNEVPKLEKIVLNMDLEMLKTTPRVWELQLTSLL